MKKYKFYFITFFLGLSFIPSAYSFRFKSLLRCIPCCSSRSVETQVRPGPVIVRSGSRLRVTKARVEHCSDEHVRGVADSLQLDLRIREHFEFSNISMFHMIIKIGNGTFHLRPNNNLLIEKASIGLGFSVKVLQAFMKEPDSRLCFVADASLWKWFGEQMIRSSALFLEVNKGGDMPHLVFECIESAGSINRFILDGFKDTM